MQGVDENFVVLSQSEASDQEDAMVTIELEDQNENWGGDYNHSQPIGTQMDISSGIKLYGFSYRLVKVVSRFFKFWALCS